MHSGGFYILLYHPHPILVFEKPLNILFAVFVIIHINGASTRIHMGRELIFEYPLALERVRWMDEILQRLEDGPSWLIEGKIVRIVTFSQLTSK